MKHITLFQIPVAMTKISVKKPSRADISSENKEHKGKENSLGTVANSALAARKFQFCCHTIWKENILLSTEA